MKHHFVIIVSCGLCLLVLAGITGCISQNLSEPQYIAGQPLDDSRAPLSRHDYRWNRQIMNW